MDLLQDQLAVLRQDAEFGRKFELVRVTRVDEKPGGGSSRFTGFYVEPFLQRGSGYYRDSKRWPDVLVITLKLVDVEFKGRKGIVKFSCPMTDVNCVQFSTFLTKSGKACLRTLLRQ